MELYIKETTWAINRATGERTERVAYEGIIPAVEGEILPLRTHIRRVYLESMDGITAAIRIQYSTNPDNPHTIPLSKGQKQRYAPQSFGAGHIYQFLLREDTSMKKAIKIKLQPAEGEYDYGASRFFGDPAVPNAWVDRFAEDIIFFGQIRLSDIAELDTEGRLPHTGYLYFFLDTAQYPYDVWVDYYDGEPDTVIEEFNECDPEFAHLNRPFMMSFESCDPHEEGNRLFGVPSSGYEPDEEVPLLLQYDPLDTYTGFLDEVDGYAYIFYDMKKDGTDGAAHFVIDRS